MLSEWQRDIIVYRMCQHVSLMPDKSMCAGQCRYRTPDGNRCLIGYLIPDSHYRASFEGKVPVTKAEATDATDDALRDALHAGLRESGILRSDQQLDDIDILFLTKLQSLHDSSYIPTLAWEGPDREEINIKAWRLMLTTSLRMFNHGWSALESYEKE